MLLSALKTKPTLLKHTRCSVWFIDYSQ